MPPLVEFLLGVVEGLTEYLPVSSTGHLILVSRVLGDSGDGADSFDIVIQLGAILAVLVHYRSLLADRAIGLFSKKPESLSLLTALVVGFVPTAIAGVLLRSTIKRLLFGPLPVAAALVVGGALMIAIERFRKSRGHTGLVGLEHVTPKRALTIGLGQCVSMWPGSSRSMCTIVAGQLSGLSTATSAEFSFLLGLPTLGAATFYEAYKARHTLAANAGLLNLGIGLFVSFLVAWAVVAGFIKYLQKHGLEPFGYYRIVVGLVVFWIVTK